MLARQDENFIADQEGVVLVEALIAFPILILLTVGILEFGNMMWQRQQLQAGVRDAARYWSRCRPVSNGASYMSCSQAIARNIAVYGNPAGSGAERVPGWTTGSVIILPAAPNTTPTPSDLVTVSSVTGYQGSPLFGAILSGSISIGHQAQLRYVGW